jgi:hypothetical protein
VKAEQSKSSSATSFTPAFSQWEKERKSGVATITPLTEEGIPGLFLSCSWLYKEGTGAYLARPMSFHA